MIEKNNNTIFENIKHYDECGSEYWYARELMPLLEYSTWQKFNNIITKAKIACELSNYNIEDHFNQQVKMVIIGSKTKRRIIDYKLSRYACYLIAQNGDSRKRIIALAQTYFAIQTRNQELLEELSEDEKRIEIRNKVKRGNLGLNQTAVKCGVKDMARFTNAGYKGLYNGETANDIFKRKKLDYRQDILDYMGSEELTNNLFRITHTNAKLKRDKVDNEYKACNTHYEVGQKVRDAIINIGSTLPEKLPTPKVSVEQLEDKNKTSV